MSDRPAIVRCAIYTRKSNEKGLDQAYNSIDSQRDFCTQYISSQMTNGWLLVPEKYDDLAFSGGTLNRPAFQKLMQHCKAGLIDKVVVYKMDRFSRDLKDSLVVFDQLQSLHVEVLSATEEFMNPSNIDEEFTRNVMMAANQHERKKAAQRIKDKIAQSKKQGMWMGGPPPLGYDTLHKKLVINKKEAKQVRFIFERFLATKSIKLLQQELKAANMRTKVFVSQRGHKRGGNPFTPNTLYGILKNPIYTGKILYYGDLYPGQHDAILDDATFQQVQAAFKEPPRPKADRVKALSGALLKGIVVCGGCHGTMTPNHTTKPGGKRYRYYSSVNHCRGLCENCPTKRVPAGELEEIIQAQMQRIFQSPEIIIDTWKQLKSVGADFDEHQVADMLGRLEPIWPKLFPAKQREIVRMLIERVVVSPDMLSIEYRAAQLDRLLEDIKQAMENPSHATIRAT